MNAMNETNQDGGSILIVEDDRGTSELEGQRLAQLGLRIERASAAAETVELLKSSQPSLMLLDYSLPGMNALDMLALLKKDSVRVPPFIMVTGRGDEAVAVESMKAGALDYIVKDAAFLENLLPTAKKALEKAALQLKLRKAEEDLRKNMRLYNFLAQVNLAAAREKEKEGLFAKICAVAVEAGGFRMAWLGVPDRDIDRIVPACSAGFVDGYLDSVRITLSEGPASGSPPNAAIATGRIAKFSDLSAGPAMEPWREKALQRGYRSTASIPLKANGVPVAVLSLYSAEFDFFTEEEQKLLAEIEGDLSLALDAISSEAKRLAAQAALERTSAQLTHVMEANPVILFRLRLVSGHLLTEWVSGNTAGITGYEAAEILDPAWFPANLHPLDKDRVLAARAAFPAKGSVTMDFRVKKKGDGYIWVHGQLKMISGVEAVGSWTDITPLMQSNERMQRILDTSPDAIFLADHAFSLLSANRAAAVFFGAPDADSLAGRTVLDFVAHGDRERVVASGTDQLRTGATVRNFEFTCLRADGSDFPAEINVAVTRNARGLPDGFLGIMRDLTERKRAENLTREMTNMQRVESLGELAGGIAHDFNNMLASIMANISLLETRCGADRETRGILGETMEAAMNAQSLTANLLSFSRGGKPVRKELDMKKALGEIFKLATSGTISDCALLAPDGLWSVEGDENQLKQTINNLLLNALQAMPSGGTLRLQAQNIPGGSLPAELPGPADHVRITVSDTGTGIPEKDLPRLFEPYFTTKSRGRGLGLAMAWSVVRNHGGHISVSSAPGKGSSFEVYLPATGRTFREEAGPRKEIIKGSGRILVLEDEELVSAAVRRMLAALGYGCEIVTDGKDALARYAEEEKKGTPFAAVLMDLTIPGGMGGKEAARRLRALAPGAKVIASSGYSDEPVMAEFKANGFDAVLPKPYKYEDLAEALTRLLRGENG